MLLTLAIIATSTATTFGLLIWLRRCEQLGIVREDAFTAFAVRSVWRARHDRREPTSTRRDGSA